jgi:DNA gyrase subunit A
MIAIQTGGRNGKVVAAKLVKREDEIMLITTGGVLIRTRVAEIRQMGRATQGVTLINLGPEEKLAGLEKVVESEENGAIDVAEDVTAGPPGDDGADTGIQSDGEPGSDDASDPGEDGGDADDLPPDEPDNHS